MLTAAELARYGRQLALPDVGLEGQERLRAARVLIVGAGGLGSPAALYLAAAGVGVLGIIDNDVVELSNLHRQLLHETSDVGREKSASAADAIHRLNPNVDVRLHQERLTFSRAVALFPDYDVVIDGSDNYATRYAINDACAELGIVWIYGSVERFSGQVSLFGAAGGPCYRCIFPEPPAPGSSASCEEIGVLGAVPGVVGAWQATEALKWIIGVGEPLVGRLLQLDLKSGTSRTIHFERRDDCTSCARVAERERTGARATLLVESPPDIEPDAVARALRDAESSAIVLLDIREPWEWSIARIGEPYLLPMGDLEEQVATLDPERELVVYCHHGARSSVAAEWLRARGFRARNLAGGIDRWSREIDPSVPRY
jgi:sulfur-carrier protein adenylyltransferase/sulfurtransferase